MPQIWMTYEEVGELLGCDPYEARSHGLNAGWARKKSRDGQTRLKLPSSAVHMFLDRYVERYIDRPQASSLQVRQMQTLAASIDFKRSLAA